jgi:aspartyl-tRNA(Asn)/glutamyl-tRNA(Gln) amidotransferase subunit A
VVGGRGSRRAVRFRRDRIAVEPEPKVIKGKPRIDTNEIRLFVSVRGYKNPSRKNDNTMRSNLWESSASELAAIYRSGECSPVEVVDAVIDRIEKVNSLINAIVTLDIEGARAAARASEARWRSAAELGPLDGVPLTVKDNIPVRGLRTTWGSKLYTNFVPVRDELSIARLRAGGAVILGKTNCPEFTLQGYTDNLLFGPTRNPWNLALTPGGSSGGAVAAVSAGLGPIAIGTDGGGSIRRPASHTGLVGLKPSTGRVPRGDGFPLILLDLETVGPMAWTVTDLVLAMKVISGPDRRDPVSLVFANRFFALESAPTCRILYIPRFGQSPVDPEIASSVAGAARVLAGLGHAVEEGDAPFDVDALAQAWSVIGQSGLAWLLRSHPEKKGKLTPAIEEMATKGAAVTAADYYAALEVIKELRTELSLFFDRYDLIMTPSAAALPWPAEEAYPPIIAGQEVGPRGHAVFTAFANMAGSPAISIPAVPSAGGLPIGFQLVSALGRDDLLCVVAAQFEQVYPWVDRRPIL